MTNAKPFANPLLERPKRAAPRRVGVIGAG